VNADRPGEGGHASLSAIRAELLALLPQRDAVLFERMARLFEPGQRSAAILSADLHLPAAGQLAQESRFELLTALAMKIDGIVLKRRGIVGKHPGDGVTAFFLVGDAGSPSKAVRMAVEASREIISLSAWLQAQEGGSELKPSLCAGLHWGPTLYIGQIVTRGRLEVAALGDEVEECAQIRRHAATDRLLASKQLIDRLDEGDAKRLRLPLERLSFRPLDDPSGEHGRVTVADIPR
jgi:class 3 adenylate cyclase